MSVLRDNRRKIVYGVLVVLLLSVLMSWSSNNPQRLLFIERLAASVLRPFQKGANAVAGFMTNTWQFFGDVRNVYRDNKQLQTELAGYAGWDLRMLEIKQENLRLRNLLKFQEAVEHQLLPAQVIGRNPSSWFSTLTIDKGAKDGLKVDMPVVTNQGLVGKIIHVLPSHAVVQLIISPSSGISAIIQRTRDNGVLLGLSTPRGYASITRLNQKADIREGDVVISSTLTGIYPKGLIIGRIVEVYDDPASMERSALVVPEVDFDRLEEVLIITNFQQQSEEPEEGDSQ